jgi:hypothetical protein
MPRTDTERLDFLQKHLSGVESKTDRDGTMFKVHGLARINVRYERYWESRYWSDIRVAIDELIDNKPKN